jgi:hypothetical protein
MTIRWLMLILLVVAWQIVKPHVSDFWQGDVAWFIGYSCGAAIWMDRKL